MLRLALEGTQLTPRTGAAEVEGEALGALARAYLLSEAVIHRVTDFIDGEVLHALLAHDIEVDTSSEAATRDSASRIVAHLSPDVGIEARFDEKHERWMLVVSRMRHGNLRNGRIDEDFLLSGDYQQIRRTAQMIAGLMGEGAVIRRGDKSLAVTSFADAMKWMLAEVERGLAKQRYKGLGEMNPGQLWETTMDPAVRRLLRVQIDDAIAADEIFTTLMGDDVEPRRAFIESNALYARNIDV
jgi:DNA gyrase subunit B